MIGNNVEVLIMQSIIINSISPKGSFFARDIFKFSNTVMINVEIKINIDAKSNLAMTSVFAYTNIIIGPKTAIIYPKKGDSLDLKVFNSRISS